MFHGPSFRGVASVDRVGTNGAEATLRTSSTARLFQSNSTPTFLSGPLLVDAAGQVLGFWAANCLDRAPVVFPMGFDSMYLYDRRIEQQEQATCRVQIMELLESGLRANFDLVDGSGHVLLRILGWEVRRFDLPERFFSFRLAPAKAFASVPWPKPLQRLSNPERFECCRVEFPADFMEADAGIWRECLAHLVLSQEERQTWRDLGRSEQRRTEWLLGRLAAKDAVRLLLRERHGLSLYPADIEIMAGNNGQPVVRVKCGSRIASTPIVSIAHSGGTAVAIATDDPNCSGLGIDIELDGGDGEVLETAGFSAEERTLLSSLDTSAKNEWLIRLWCAKEAVAKALRSGMQEGPGDLLVQHIDLETGMVNLTISNRLAQRLPEFQGRAFTAGTMRATGLILASSTCERN